MAKAAVRRYVLHLANGAADAFDLLPRARQALGSLGSLSPSADSDDEHFLLSLDDGTLFGNAIGTLAGAGIQVLACREERSGVERAFLELTGEEET